MKSFIYIAFLLLVFILIYSLLGMQIFSGKFDLPNNPVRSNYDYFLNAFITVFQVMTMENWQDILFVSMRSDVNKLITSVYLISWIFLGNYVLLNLFLAILIDGFTS